MIPGNDDGRDVVARMTPLEALLAIEAFGIASNSMLFYPNRGMEMATMLQEMAVRMGASAGISHALASRIADRRSPIYEIARELAGGGIGHTTVVLDTKDGKVVVMLDGRRFELCDSPFDKKAVEKAETLSWSSRRTRIAELRDQGFAPFACELVELLRRIAPVDVGFSVEQIFSLEMRRDAIVGEVTEDAVSARVIETIATVVDADVETVSGWPTDIDANVYGRGDVMYVRVRCVAPWEWRDDLCQAVVAELSTPRPGHGHAPPSP